MKMSSPLGIKVKVLEGSISLRKPCQVEVTVVNEGRGRLLINGRLAVGYKNTLSRELFADLEESTSHAKARIIEVDYDRNFSPRSDYVNLEPGGSLSRSFDLFEWYAPTQPGVYQLVMHYQADEPLASFPEDVARGTYSSPPVELKVQGGRSE